MHPWILITRRIWTSLKPEVRNYFFKEEPGIFSKVDDLPPAKYNAGSDVKNSLIASGCIINSKVENSILFKKVFVGKNCVIKNSIILNDVYIGDNTHIENCIVESRDTLKANTYYCGENGIKIVSENMRDMYYSQNHRVTYRVTKLALDEDRKGGLRHHQITDVRIRKVKRKAK